MLDDGVGVIIRLTGLLFVEVAVELGSPRKPPAESVNPKPSEK
jgi:hypothetical protein